MEDLVEGTDEWFCIRELNDSFPKEIMPLLKYILLTRRNTKSQRITIILKRPNHLF